MNRDCVADLVGVNISLSAPRVAGTLPSHPDPGSAPNSLPRRAAGGWQRHLLGQGCRANAAPKNSAAIAPNIPAQDGTGVRRTTVPVLPCSVSG